MLAGNAAGTTGDIDAAGFSTSGTRCKVVPVGREVVVTVVTDTCAVETAGGTSAIGGAVDDGAGLGAAGLSPCNSNFLSSSDVIRPRIRVKVCFFSVAEESASLRWRCV